MSEPNRNEQNNERPAAEREKNRDRGEQNARNAQNPQNAQNAQNARQGQNAQGGNRKNQKNRDRERSRENREKDRERDRERREKENRKKQPPKPQPHPNAGNANKKKAQKGNRADDGRKDTYVYVLDGNVYINLTNKCSNACHFCVRNERASYFGNYLWLRNGDPTPEKVIAALNALDLSAYREVVFCGFGEPTYRMAEMSAVADYVHERGLSTRLNTNGQGSLINKRDIVPELKGKIAKINISLNAASAEKYQPICRSQFGEAGYTGMLDFARECRRAEIECWFSVVDVIGEDEVAACRRVAEMIGIPLRVRAYISES